jgi:hypothetical protein
MSSLWGAKWISDCRLDGHCEHLLYENLLPALFKTRREARAFIEKKYGYIRHRPDLRREPHGWRMPQPVRVTVAMADLRARAA